ncbi:MAG: hypothetical protein JWN86_541 [Planctomycetota bacterium]|nr:hypothetical protein [Planctomycetota bacterium]
MRFALFILLNATLFIRPAEIVPSLEGLQIYYVMILACLIVYLPGILDQFSAASLTRQPISLFVLGLLATVGLSQLARLDMGECVRSSLDFVKIVAYYLVLVACLDTPARLRAFLTWMVVIIVGLTVVALLHYHEVILVASIQDVLDSEVDAKTSQQFSLKRLASTGIYGDPNDLCLILLVGMVISLFRFNQPDLGLLRFVWVGPLVLFGYALSLTHSRGGFLGLLAGVTTLLWARFGIKKMIPLAALALPIIFVLFAGRQTKLSASEDTGQDRVQLWSRGLELFRESPVFGIGSGRYADEAGLVAHNTYINTFTELGILGGSFFLGACYFAFHSIHGLGQFRDHVPDTELRRLRPYLLAMLATYGAGMISLSRGYVIPTYMMLGLSTAYLQVVGSVSDLIPPRLDAPFLRRLLLVNVGFLVGLYAFIRIFARFGL